MNYETERRNKNRGYMKLMVWQKGMELFELAWTIVFRAAKIDFKFRSQITDATQSVSANIAGIAEDPEEYSTNPLLDHSMTPAPAHA